jgi:cytochrome bd-type quinol oxidase subunit 1
LRSSNLTDTEQFKDQSYKRFRKQILVITIFYVFSSIMDWVYLEVGRQQLIIGNITCLNNNYLLVVDSRGSYILLLYTLVTYSYAAVLLYVFYYIPKKSGLVVDFTLENMGFQIDSFDSDLKRKSFAD